MTPDTIILKVRDKNKFYFLIQLLEQLGFVDIDFNDLEKRTKGKHDFFKSAGLLKNWKITAGELREKAWKRNQ